MGSAEVTNLKESSGERRSTTTVFIDVRDGFRVLPEDFSALIDPVYGSFWVRAQLGRNTDPPGLKPRSPQFPSQYGDHFFGFADCNLSSYDTAIL